ncbi:MAG: hypothetical protein JXB29_00955 [Sedimentisphaerales bacterium]|nr:hypothetical protein [Sedimentisphaerales bacterium]
MKLTDEKLRLKNIYLQPAFLICVAVLAISAGGMSAAIKKFGIYLEKVPLPLKKPLELMDQSNLAPYKVVAKKKIDNKDVLESLGTQDYIQWLLEDTEVADNNPIRKFMLFVTYYDLPDRVPHVPEECYVGGGYQKVASDNVMFEVKKSVYPANQDNYSRAKGHKDDVRKIEGKYLVFTGTQPGHWWNSSKFPVLYLFHVNGTYASSREKARLALNRNIFRKSSYFCKIEIIFNQSNVSPTKAEAVASAHKLLDVILPVLEKEHLPDW